MLKRIDFKVLGGSISFPCTGIVAHLSGFSGSITKWWLPLERIKIKPARINAFKVFFPETLGSRGDIA